MEQHLLEAQRDHWDQVFAEDRAMVVPHVHWLDELVRRASIHLAGPVLEIGCGRGRDTVHLLKAGCCVTCMDLSWSALQQVSRLSSSLHCVNAALPASLPFRAETFAYVVAGLSLHYFRWEDTCHIVRELGRVLHPGGAVFFRVNATDDVAHGAGRGEEVEPNLFLHQGRLKRFFTAAMCQDLFPAPWTLDLLMPWVETRPRSVKPCWMGVARRP